MKKKWKLFLKLIMVLLIGLTSCMMNMNFSFALSTADVSEFPVGGTLTYHGKAIYGENIVGDFTVNGVLAFCMQHELTTPPTGTAMPSRIYDNVNVRKVLYYGYNGVAPWSGFKSRQHGIVVTSLALSYYYAGDNSSPATIKDFIDYIQGQSVPDYAIKFSKSKVNAYKEGNMQRTESITLQSGSDVFGLTMSLQSQITYVDETHGTRQTGGSVSIMGKTVFHLEAPLSVNLDQWTSGQKISSYAYQPVVYEPSSSSLQSVGYGRYISDKSKTTSLTVDWLKSASLELTKTDLDGHMIDGAVFHLWNNQGYSQDITVTNGTMKVNDLSVGQYYLQEKSAPSGYLLDSTVYEITLNAGDEGHKVVSNKEPQGEIQLKKSIDSSTTNDLLGDSYLENVEYGLYAKDNITNKAKTKTYYMKDQLISKQSTNKEGKITWTGLPIGNYYVKELQTNPSLIIDEKSIDVSLTYQDMNTSVVIKKVNATDRIASQRIQIFKEGTKNGETGVVKGLQGAEFTFVLETDYKKIGFEKAKKYFVGSTDKNGFLTTTLLPYGIYRVKETKTPQGYYGANDFLVTIDKDASLYEIGYQIKKVTVNNLPFESLLKVIKLDQETGKTVQRAHATFKIKNLDTNEYVSYTDWSSFPQININQWSTHEDGTITLNTKLKIGHYQLEEIKAPEGYVLNEKPLKFEITDRSYEIAEDKVTPLTIVKYSDKAVKGRIVLHKQGEVLSGYQNGKFIYETKGLASSQFEIRACEDILDASHDGSILYKKGQVVETLVTDSNGNASSSKLPLGHYEYQEIVAPQGYQLDNEVKNFTLSYQNQNIELVQEKFDIMNKRVKVIVEAAKKDEETHAYIAGAEISLIANRDIMNAQKEVIVKAGTVIESIISTDNGKVKFQSDLPIDFTDDDQLIGDSSALFVLKETKAPAGYLPKTMAYYIDTKSHNQNETQLSFEYDFFNQKIPVETLGDQPPVETKDTTIILSYLLMGLGVILIFNILMKKENKD